MDYINELLKDEDGVKMMFCAYVRQMRDGIMNNDRSPVDFVLNITGSLFEAFCRVPEALNDFRRLKKEEEIQKLFDWRIIAPNNDAERLVYSRLFTDRDHTDDIQESLLLRLWKEMAEVHTEEATKLLYTILNCSSAPNIELVRVLLQKGASLQYDDDEPWYMFIRSKTSVELLELLLPYDKYDSSHYLKNYDDGCGTILMHSCSVANLEAVKFLVDHGHNINEAHPLTGETCLFYLLDDSPFFIDDPLNAISPLYDTFIFLVRKGIDLNHKNKYGLTALSAFLPSIGNNIRYKREDGYTVEHRKLQHIIVIMYDSGYANRTVLKEHLMKRKFSRQAPILKLLLENLPLKFLQMQIGYLDTQIEALEKGSQCACLLSKLNSIFCACGKDDHIFHPDEVRLNKVPFHRYMDGLSMIFLGQLTETHVLHKKSVDLYGPSFGLLSYLPSYAGKCYEVYIPKFQERLKKIAFLAHTNEASRTEVAKIAERDALVAISKRSTE
jgi:hypothetical protein